MLFLIFFQSGTAASSPSQTCLQQLDNRKISMDHVIYPSHTFQTLVPMNPYPEQSPSSLVAAHHMSNPSLYSPQDQCHRKSPGGLNQCGLASNLSHTAEGIEGKSYENDSLKLNPNRINTKDKGQMRSALSEVNYQLKSLQRQQSYGNENSSCQSENSHLLPSDSLLPSMSEQQCAISSLLPSMAEQQCAVSSCSLHDLSTQKQQHQLHQQPQFGLPRELSCRQDGSRHSSMNRDSREDGSANLDFSSIGISNRSGFKGQLSSAILSDNWSKSMVPVSHYATLGKKPILKNSIRGSVSVKSGVGDFLSSKNQESAV